MWNWNVDSDFPYQLVMLINHTNVELKCDSTRYWYVVKTINHTNVELKLYGRLYLCYIAFWLIIPMWNWNEENPLIVNYWTRLIIPMWNWNQFAFVLPYGGGEINHTNVELKFKNSITIMINFYNRLIIPMWNWNTYSFSNSFLYVRLIIPMWNWNMRQLLIFILIRKD